MKNLAANGSAYWVFATITPLNDGYLSVRCKPCRTDLRDAAYSLYQVVRPHELEGRQHGSSVAQVAVDGLGELAELLAGAGFPSYQDFQLLALPAEVEARHALSKGIPKRPDATGPLATMLGAVTTLAVEVDGLVDRLSYYQRLADEFAAGVTSIGESVSSLVHSVATAEAAADQVEGRAPVLVNTTKAISKVAVGVVPQLESMHETLADLRRRVAELRFRIALAKLHTDMVGNFVAELIDEVPQFEDALPAIPELCQALDEGIKETATDLETTIERTRAAADQLNESRGRLKEIQDLLANWRIFVTRYGVRSELKDMVPVIDAEVTNAFQKAVEMGKLAAECRAVAVPWDTRTALAQLEILRGAIQEQQLSL